MRNATVDRECRACLREINLHIYVMHFWFRNIIAAGTWCYMHYYTCSDVMKSAAFTAALTLPWRSNYIYINIFPGFIFIMNFRFKAERKYNFKERCKP